MEAEQDSGAARAKANSHARHASFMMEKREDGAAALWSFLQANLKERKKWHVTTQVFAY